MNASLRIVLLGVLVTVGSAGAYELFAPEQSTRVDDGGAVTLGPDATVLATGTFTGKAGHHVSGTVELVRDGEAHYLRFVNYRQTQGPDVFVYLTSAPDPDTRGEVESGFRVLVDGGADGGESTKEGTFVQRLPAGVDPTGFQGVAIWCDRFDTPFGAATLREA